jgi:hypothetical protein
VEETLREFLAGLGTHVEWNTAVTGLAQDGDGVADVRDADGHAQRAYAAADGELILVRPDGHIGLRTTDPDGITRYLAPFRGGALQGVR